MAADKTDRTDFEQYASELAGSSRDRPLRCATGQLIRRLLTEIDRRDWCAAQSYFADYPTIILGLDEPGLIYTGMGALDNFSKVWDDIAAEMTVPKIIIVDRGRVNCHLTEFYIPKDKAKDEDAVMVEHSYILIFDLDEHHKITRMEYRDTNQDRKEHKGGRKMLDSLVENARKAASTVNYNS